MKRILNRRNTPSVKRESVEDPHELLLSLVDLGSLDAEDALLACVQEMSDAECKRVLGSLSLPTGTELEDEEEPMDDGDDINADLVPLDDVDDAFADDEAPADDEEPAEDEEAEAEDEDVEECNNRELEAKVRRLERLAFGKKKELKNEATRYYYEWETNFDKAKKIYMELLKNPIVNPDGHTIDEFKIETIHDCMYLKNPEIELNTDCPEFKQILGKHQALKTYDVQFSNFGNGGTGRFKGTYLALVVKQKVRKSEWYDPEFGPGFDRDLYMQNRRNAEWARAQRDNHGWW